MDYTLNVNGRLLSLQQPQVMGILNVTPDSFFEGSRKQTEREIAERAQQIVREGGAIIDVGGFSTRPGASIVSAEEEMERLRNTLTIIRREVADVVISVDTYRPEVARMVVEEFGAAIINDVSEGGITGIAGQPLEDERGDVPRMFSEVARLGVAYVLMSVQPTIQPMLQALSQEVDLLHSLGQKDIIIDPGFGFGKTLEQNYLLMDQLEMLHALQLPLLVGISRKSMIYRLLKTDPTRALNGTTALNTAALLKGAHILRVHDVAEAAECISIVQSIHIHRSFQSTQDYV